MPKTSSHWTSLYTAIFLLTGYIELSSGTEGETAQSSTWCILPNIEHVRLAYELDSTKTLNQGTYVPHMSLIVYQCAAGYQRDGPQFNLCLNGSWHTKRHASCIKHCRSEIFQGVTFKAECQRDGIVVSCYEPVKPGTVAHITCQPNYRKPSERFLDNIFCQEDGQWDYLPSRCDPSCGELVTHDTPFIVNGSPTKISFVPWHVGIYKMESGSYRHVCGGTILNANVVISSASCFWDAVLNLPYDKTLFSIGAGKLYRDYNGNDPKAQFRNISEIKIPSDFIPQTLEGDIAMLVLEDPLQFTPLIAAICFELGYNEQAHVANNTYGHVAGFLSTQAETVTGDIQINHIPAMSYEHCKGLKDPLAEDKFCAKNWFNSHSPAGLTGSGFVKRKFSKSIKKNKHYLWGVVSAASLNPSDYSNSFIFFTNIQSHKRFVISQRIINRPK